MQRCFDLARLGAGFVSPNPMVGAVMVHENKIIGEGWHQQYGAAHAEVNCVQSVLPENQHLIAKSTLYCSLEPCYHFGKTPPCVDLVLREKIPHVVISNIDPNPLTGGHSIAKLRSGGVKVETGVLEKEGAELNRAFFTWITQKRPYIILKWAQSADGFIGKKDERTAISGPEAQRLVHRWRSECDAILVGANTALVDNPRLDNRLYFGKSPLRIAFDTQGRLPITHHLLDDRLPTWIIGPQRTDATFSQTQFFDFQAPAGLNELLELLRENKRAMLLVEGGANLLNQFIGQGLWDEARILQAPKRLGEGVAAPLLPQNAEAQPPFSQRIGSDTYHRLMALV